MWSTDRTHWWDGVAWRRVGPDGRFYSNGERWFPIPLDAIAPISDGADPEKLSRAAPPLKKPMSVGVKVGIGAGSFVILLIILGIIGAATGGGSKQTGAVATPNPPSASPRTPSPKPSPTPSPTPAPTAEATPIPSTMVAPTSAAPPTPSPATPAPVATPKSSPTSAPKAPADPHALTVANVTQSISDNENFWPRHDFSAMTITIASDGSVTVTITPTTLQNEEDTFNIAAYDAIIVYKSIFGWYGTATSVKVDLRTDFIDAYGKTTTEDAVWLTASAATAAQFQYDGLIQRTVQNTYIIYDDVDSYYIHPAIWKNLDANSRGDLVDFTK